MDTNKKLEFLRQQLDTRIKDFRPKREHNKRFAFQLKISSVLLAALITIILGLKVDNSWSPTLQNIALVMGALITVINAVEAFFDHRSLWVRETVTLVRLYDLQRDVEFYSSGIEQNELDGPTLARFMKRYDQIMSEDLQTWLKLRGDTISPASSAVDRTDTPVPTPPSVSNPP